ncbi:MAG: lamin tail domain-containing protein [Polaribacter sp.]|nr:lamin tail domain-containing protein [Polaribacter sp.]
MVGATDDTYTATVTFTGGNTGKTFVVTSTAGTVGGDNPTNLVTGTITISNIPEGTDITVTVSDTANGGVCNLTKDINSPACLPIIINETLFDPALDDANTTAIEGDANGDGVRDALQDEFIEFFNTSNSSLDISGFTISDAIQVRHTFAANTIIPAKSAMVVFGGGTPTGSFGGAIVQTASEGELNLSNTGDIITLKNTQGDEVIVFVSADYSLNFGNDQSITRSPDITGNFTLHTDAQTGVFYSPGTKIDGSTLDVTSFTLNQVNVYPNPVTKNNRYVSITSNITGEMNISVYNVLGKK